MAKEIMSFTIDKELLDSFKSFCDENFINRSAVVEDLLDSYLTNKLKIKKDLKSFFI